MVKFVNLSAENLKRGEKADFEAFYKGYYGLFLSFALKFCQDREMCRDIVREVFIRYWESHDAFDDLVSIKVFFYRSIRNECINYLKRQAVHEKFVNRQMQETQETFFLDQIFREEVAHIIREYVSRLPSVARQVILLAMDDKTNEEIARELSLSVNTVKTHKARVYSLLREKLQHLRMLCLYLADFKGYS